TLRSRPRSAAGNPAKRSTSMNEACEPIPTDAPGAAIGEPESSLLPEACGGSHGVEIFASGLNGALNRLPKVHCVSLPVGVRGEPVMPWRPSGPRVKTISVLSPAGLEFLPPKRAESGLPFGELVPVAQPVVPIGVASGAASPERKPTRIKPSTDA